MLDTVASNKTAQVTLGVLQQPQSTIVNYYCVVNCYYFVSLVVPSVMTCIATLSAVMRWVFVHYLSGEKYWGLLLNWQNDRGIGIRGVELAKRWTHHKLVARSTAKGLLLAVLHSWEKTSCPSTVSSSSFFFHSYWSLLKHTHADTHTHIWETVLFLSSCAPKAAFQLTQCISVSSLKSFYMVLAYTCSVGLWMDISGLSTIALLCAVFGLWILTAL